MVGGELQPAVEGTTKFDKLHTHPDRDNIAHQRMNDIRDDVGRHGEVHAQFDGYDQDVEVRLGTSLFDFRTESIKVFDGDQYHVFSMEQYQGHYVPMRVFH